MNAGVPDAALINGSAAREPWLLDRGLHFGDGLFETISCRQGRPRFLDLHFERLAAGCRRLDLPALDATPLRAQVRALASQADACIVKLIVTRGEAVARGYGYTGDERPTTILLRYASPPQPVNAGFTVGIAQLRLGENPALAGIKHLNRLEQVLAQRERQVQGKDELLMFSRSERLISGTMSNVFLVLRGELLTPALDLCGVAGIMRRVVMSEAHAAGIRCEERVLGEADLRAATEVFLTSSRLGLVPVVGIDGRSVTSGATTGTIAARIAPMLENPVDG